MVFALGGEACLAPTGGVGPVRPGGRDIGMAEAIVDVATGFTGARFSSGAKLRGCVKFSDIIGHEEAVREQAFGYAAAFLREHVRIRDKRSNRNSTNW